MADEHTPPREQDQKTSTFSEKLSAGLLGLVATMIVNAFVPILKPFSYGFLTHLVVIVALGWLVYPLIAASKNPIANVIHSFVCYFSEELFSRFSRPSDTGEHSVEHTEAFKPAITIGTVIEKPGGGIIIRDSNGFFLADIKTPGQLVGYTQNTVSVKRGKNISVYELKGKGNLQHKSTQFSG